MDIPPAVANAINKKRAQTVHGYGEKGYDDQMRKRRELATKKERQIMDQRAAKAEQAVKKAAEQKVCVGPVCSWT